MRSDRPSEVYAAPGPSDARPSCCQLPTKSSQPARRAVLRTLCIALVALAGFSPALAQHVEASIMLPDSLGGAVDPDCLVYDSLNSTIYVGSLDAVHAVDVNTCRKVARIPVGGKVVALCVATRHNKVYVATETGSLVVLDGYSNRVVDSIAWRSRPAALAYSDLTDRVYSGDCGSPTITVIDAAHDTVLAEIQLPTQPCGLFYSHATAKLYCGGNSCIAVFNELTGAVTAVNAPGSYWSPACANATGEKVYVAGTAGVEVLDGRADTLVRHLAIVGSPPVGMYYSRALHRAFYLSGGLNRDAYVFAIDDAGDSILGCVRLRRTATALAGSSAGERLYCTQMRTELDGALVVLKAQTLEVETSLVVGAEPVALAMVPGPDRAYCLCRYARNLVAVDGAACTTQAAVWLGARALNVCYAAAEGKLYYANLDDWGCIGAIDASSNRVVATLPASASSLLCYHRAGGKLYANSYRPEGVTVYDTRGDSLVCAIPLAGQVRALLLHPERRKLYVMLPDFGVAVVDAQADTVVTLIPLPDFGQTFLLSPEMDKLWYFWGTVGNLGLAVIDCSADSVAATYQLDWLPEAVCLESSRTKLYCCMGTQLRILDAVSDTLIAVLRQTRPGWAGRGDVIYVAAVNKVYWYVSWSDSAYGDSLTVVDVRADSIVGMVEAPDGFAGMCIGQSGNVLYVADCAGGQIFVVDCRRDSVVRANRVGGSPNDMAVVPDFRRLYIGDLYYARLVAMRDSLAGLSGGGGAGGRSRGATLVCDIEALGPGGRGSGLPAQVYDAAGRAVATVNPGQYRLRRRLPAGVYFVTTERACSVMRVVLVR